MSEKGRSALLPIGIVCLGLLVLAVVGLIFIGLPVGSIARPVLSIYFTFSEDTRFAPGYSEKAFRAVKVGDTETSVTGALGKPLSIYESEPWLGWVYSDRRVLEYEREAMIPGGRTVTVFKFNVTNEVTQVYGQVSQGMNERGEHVTSLGNGANSLGLDYGAVESWKGKGTNAVRKAFGDPVSTYYKSSVKTLIYSDSPSSGNYWKRRIEIDADGKVTRVDGDRYFD